MGKDVEVITGYEKIKKILESQDYIARFMPAGKGLTLILNESGDVGYALVLGVKFEDYQKMFLNNVRLVEGTFLKNDDRGILVSTGNRKRIYDEQGFWLVPEGLPLNEKNLTAGGAGAQGQSGRARQHRADGRELENTSRDIKIEVKGIVEYEYLDEFWKNFNIMDIESFREAFQYVTASDALRDTGGKKEAPRNGQPRQSVRR